MQILKDLNRITAILLAALMFISTVGFTVDMHYCKGQLKTISFFGKAKTCHEGKTEETNSSCPNQKLSTENSCDAKKRKCCNSKIAHFQSDIDQQLQGNNFELTPKFQYFLKVAVPIFLIQSLADELVNLPVALLFLKPPPGDFFALVQTWLL